MGERINVQVQRQQRGGPQTEERPAIWIRNEVQPRMLDHALGIWFFQGQNGAIHFAPLDQPAVTGGRFEETAIARRSIVGHAWPEDTAIHPAIDKMDMARWIAIRRWIPRHSFL